MIRPPFLLIMVIALAACSRPAGQWDFLDFHKPSANPILQADSSFTFFCPVRREVVQWQKADVFNPAAIVKDDRVFLLTRCEDNPQARLGGRTSRIGLAYSDDGIHFTSHPTPVLYPDSSEFLRYDWPGGCEDPRVVQTEAGMYVLTYTSWNHETARLSVAFSNDLYHWEKQGPAFEKAYNGQFLDLWSKSGSIITRMADGRPVAAEIDGKYWMYWGETFINLAWSDNLADWYPQVDEAGELVAIVEPRPGKFDSHLTECGPPALIRDGGIVLLYNGRNAEGEDADPGLPGGTYCVGMLVFDEVQPDRVIYRSGSWLLKPTLPHEVSGQYQSGTTFGEGWVWFDDRWFLYYGTADSFIGVAISE